MEDHFGHKNENEIGSEVCLCRSDESQNLENDAQGNDPMVLLIVASGQRCCILITQVGSCDLMEPLNPKASYEP